MNVLERILALDFSHPALWGGLGYVLLRELGPRAWRGWRRLRDLRDPMDVLEYRRAALDRTSGMPEASAGLDPTAHGRAILGMGDETATERYVRMQEPHLMRFGRMAKYKLGPVRDQSLADLDWLRRHPPPRSLDADVVDYLFDLETLRTRDLARQSRLARERLEAYRPPTEPGG
jgi:hypothetical protein